MVAYSFQRRFVNPVRVGLGLPIDQAFGQVQPVRPKLQTIRGFGGKRHALPGDVVQLYFGMRTKQCKKIGDARCTKAREIFIEFMKGHRLVRVSIPGETSFIPDRVDPFFYNDGFETREDFWEFWSENNDCCPGVFRGVIINWEPIK